MESNFFQSLQKESWEEVRLGEVIETNCKNIDKNYPHKIIQHLDTGSITSNRIESLQIYSFENLPSRAKRIVSDEDIIYSLVRPIQRHFGFIKNPPVNLIVSTGFCTIICNKSKIDAKFLYYFLMLDETIEFLDLIAEASTSAYPAIKPSDIENLTIPLPPLKTQEKIAQILSSFDDKVDLLHKQNKTLESLAQTLFRHHFIENAKEDWEVGKLGDYVKIIDNRGKTPPTHNAETNYPIIEVNALSGDSRLVNYKAIKKYVSQDIYDSWFRAGHPKKYDILLSTVGSIGELAMFLEEKGAIAQNVVALRANNISPFYLYEKLKFIQKDLKEFDIGSVQPSIKVTHLIDIEIVKPPMCELENFDKQMVCIVDKLYKNSQQIQNLESMRDIILKKILG